MINIVLSIKLKYTVIRSGRRITNIAFEKKKKNKKKKN